MVSRICCLRQHIRNEPTNPTFVDLSLDDNVLKYLIRCPNLLESHTNELFELHEVDETRYEPGSVAILHTQNGFAFLEALSDDVSIESLGRNFDGVSAHTGMKVRPSTKTDIPSALQLLPGQSFYIGKMTLSLVPKEHGDLPIHLSGLPDSNFENYNYQVSQLSTPQRTARAASTVMETPMPQRDHGSEISAHILPKITGHALSGRKDSTEWPETPSRCEVMRTVGDVSEPDYSNPQAKCQEKQEHMADAAMNENHSFDPQPKIKIEDDMIDAAIAKPLERVVDLEDPGVARIDFGNNTPEQSDSLTLKSRIHQKAEPEGLSASCVLEEMERSSSRLREHPDDEPRNSSRSPMSTALKRPPSPVEGVQPKGRLQGSDPSPFLQATSDSSSQGDDDLEDAQVRKKAKTATVSNKALNEESQDSRQDEVVFIQNDITAPTDCSVSLDQPSSIFPISSVDTGHRSNSADPPNQNPFTPLVGSKHISPTDWSDSRPCPTSRLPLKSVFDSNGPSPQPPPSDLNTVLVSPSSSGEPNSSMRSTRSTTRGEQYGSSSTDPGIRVVFASSSSAGESKPFMRFLSSKGAKKVKSVHDCTVLCVGKELKKTGKVILAVLLGKDIVTDSWIVDSVKGNDLLSIVPYIARDAKKEADWGISLEQAIYRGKQGLKILQDYTIHLTPSVKKELGKSGFDELKEIVKCAGAKSVSSALPKKRPEATPSTFIVATHDDAEMAELQTLGWRAYVKDIVSLSVLRGRLDLESDEFLITKEQKKESSRKRKR